MANFSFGLIDYVYDIYLSDGRKNKSSNKSNKKVEPLSEEVDDGELLQDIYDKKLTREKIINKMNKW